MSLDFSYHGKTQPLKFPVLAGSELTIWTEAAAVLK